MNTDKTFSAPWGLPLKVMTALGMAIFIGIPVTVLLGTGIGQFKWPILLPPTILIAGAFFMIRSYELRLGELKIKRLGWSTRLDLTDLQSIELDPTAMSGSIRTCGNGGLFCFAGWFRNKKLGSYRVFATDLKKCVVIKFPKGTVVVTPGDPDAFVKAVTSGS